MGRRSSLEDPPSLTGAELHEVIGLIPPGWETSATKKEGGLRAFKPGTRRSDGLRVMPGDPAAPDPFHRGPRVIITHGGVTWRIPLKGNPVLE